MPTSLELMRANFARRKDIQAELAEIDEKVTTENRAYNEEEQATIETRRAELAGIDGRITANLEIETRSADIANGMEHLAGVMLDRQSGNMIDTRSAGQRFVEDEGYEEFAKSPRKGFQVDFDGLDIRSVTDTTTATTSSGAFYAPTVLPRIAQTNLDRRVYLSDLLPRMQVSTGAIDVVQDTSPLADMANKAVEVTEGSAKPQAGVTLTQTLEPIATVAAWVNITRQAFADYPQIQSYLDGRLRYSLKRRLDSQLINGDGSAPNIKGMKNRSGIVTYSPGSSEARAISIRHTITLMEQAEAVPEVIALNPADAELFDLTNSTSAGLHAVMDNDSTGQGAYAGPPSRTAWGLTQVHSNAVTSGTALLIDPMAVSVLDRMQPTAYTTDSHASNFTSNLLTLLLELRAGLAVFAPSGIALVTFNGTA